MRSVCYRASSIAWTVHAENVRTAVQPRISFKYSEGEGLIIRHAPSLILLNVDTNSCCIKRYTSLHLKGGGAQSNLYLLTSRLVCAVNFETTWDTNQKNPDFNSCILRIILFQHAYYAVAVFRYTWRGSLDMNATYRWCRGLNPKLGPVLNHGTLYKQWITFATTHTILSFDWAIQLRTHISTVFE